LRSGARDPAVEYAVMEGCKDCKGYEWQERRERPSPRSRGNGGDTSVERAGMPRLGVHDLRHTRHHAPASGRTPIGAVSERLGHAKTSITLNTYAHILPDMQDRAVDAIERNRAKVAPIAHAG
jgi:integrase